jgi:hypothetical protein
MSKLLAASMSFVTIAAFVWAGPTASEAQRIGNLIEQLSSGNYRERIDAFRSLDAIGESALEKLRLATKSADTETAHRAAELVRRIEHRVNSARILAAKLIEVEIVDKPIPEAVREFQSKTGLPVTLTGDTSRLSKRRVTFKSGQVPMWEALAGFCAAAHLSEWNGLTPVPGLPTPNVTGEAPGNAIILPQGGVRFRSSSRGTGSNNSAQVFLYDETPVKVPTFHAGAARIRALPIGTPIPNMTFDSDEVVIPLQVSLEPRLSWSGAPSIKIGQATDDREQRMTASVVNLAANPMSEDDFMMMQIMMAGNPYGNYFPQRSQYVALRLQPGEKPPKTLRELSGTLSLPLRVTGPIITAANPIKLVGQVIHGPYGSMTIHAMDRQDNGHYKVDVAIDMAPDVQLPMANPVGGANRVVMMPNVQVQIQGGVIVQNVNGGIQNIGGNSTEFMGLSLADADGKRWTAGQVAQQQMNYDPSGCKMRMILIFRPSVGAGEPASLTFTATHPASVETEFRFTDLPLP